METAFPTVYCLQMYLKHCASKVIFTRYAEANDYNNVYT